MVEVEYGDDGWAGTLPTSNAYRMDGPFATLTRARDEVCRRKAKVGLKEPLRVLVRGGKYYLDETVVLSAVDSGTRVGATAADGLRYPFVDRGPLVRGSRPGRLSVGSRVPGSEARIRAD